MIPFLRFVIRAPKQQRGRIPCGELAGLAWFSSCGIWDSSAGGVEAAVGEEGRGVGGVAFGQTLASDAEEGGGQIVVPVVVQALAATLGKCL
jgi:hypothetical protein